MAKKLPTVAIIGQANVGKSSLFNRLVRSRQAIVAEEAGTTRDNVIGKVTYYRTHTKNNQTTNYSQQSATRVALDTRSEAVVDDFGSENSQESSRATKSPEQSATRVALDTRSEAVVDDFGGEDSHESSRATKSPEQSATRVALDTRSEAVVDDFGGETAQHNDIAQFWLVDTAGLKNPEDDFEATIQDQINEAVISADAIIVMVDSTLYPSDADRLVAKKALKSRKPVILVTNKVDLKGNLPVNEFKRLGIKTIIRTSAEHNQGISELLDQLANHLPPANSTTDDDIIRVALIGRPNVGKSHLFNTLAGKQQAVVANIAGTTRDLNRITVRYQKQAIELIDTAGIRRQGKQETGIEKFSVLRTMQAINEADICLLLMDVNELNTQLDQRLAGIIDEAGKGMVLVVSKWDSVIDKDAYTRDALAPQISYNFKFTPWAPLIFTSSVTGQNVTKLFDLILDIHKKRRQQIKTRQLNDLLQQAIISHPPAGLKNSHPKLRYIVQTDIAPPWFVIYGSNLKFIHWSYKRYLERTLRETFDFAGTPIKFSFRDEKQLKANRQRIAEGKEPVTKAYKQAKEAEKK